MKDTVTMLVESLEMVDSALYVDDSGAFCLRSSFDDEKLQAALSAAKGGGWLPVADCPNGDVWFALSCGHVVQGVKSGMLLLDWEQMIDHDCCADASAISAQQVVSPCHPTTPKGLI